MFCRERCISWRKPALPTSWMKPPQPQSRWAGQPISIHKRCTACCGCWRAQAEIGAMLEAYDFSKYGVIADIAGGRGHFLNAVLAKYRAVNGILFDLPDVVGSVEPSPRMSLVGGNFFKDALPKADAYILS